VHFDHILDHGLVGLNHPATLIQIDPFSVKGEEGTGFEKAADLGEFECANCSFFDKVAGACNQSTMKSLSKQPRLADGRVVVSGSDCCEYVDRIGKKETEESHERE
jgi:hypothetical protein